jgi:SWIM/SEC-C metal-binding protein
MSDKFFFKGRPMHKPEHKSDAYSTKRKMKLGTTGNPMQLMVTSEERSLEIKARLAEHHFIGEITVDAAAEENIADLEGMINKPVTTRIEITPNRNDPCSCGSGKKYKKCCG